MYRACEIAPFMHQPMMPSTRNIRAHIPLQRNFQSLFGEKIDAKPWGMDAGFEECVFFVDCNYDFIYPDARYMRMIMDDLMQPQRPGNKSHLRGMFE